MELGSIKLASEELGLAQSTLSEHLKQVEQSLDTLLFTRGKNGLQITPQGQSLYRYTHLIFKTADKIKNIFSTDEEITNCIDVGILTSVTNSRTSKFLIPLFDDENTLVRIHQGDSDFLVKRFIHREIDLFLTDYKLALPHLDGLESEYLGSMSYVLVYNSNYQEIKKIYSDKNQKLPYVHSSIKSEIRWATEQFFSQRGVDIVSRGESDDILLVKEIIDNVPSCAALPLNVVENELNEGVYSQLDVDPLGKAPLYANYLNGDSIENVVQAIERLKSSLKVP